MEGLPISADIAIFTSYLKYSLPITAIYKIYAISISS